jgi:hypothetical protein
MLAKLTTKNQITIPRDIMSSMPDEQYFDVSYRDGNIILKPVRVYETDLCSIRNKMEQLGIPEKSVEEAVKWARKR